MATQIGVNMPCSLSAPCHNWTNVDYHQRCSSIFTKVLINLIHNMCSENTFLKLLPHLPGNNELTPLQWWLLWISFQSQRLPFVSLYVTTQLVVCATKQTDSIQLMKYSPQQWTQVRSLDKMPQWGMARPIHFIIYFESLSKKAYLN